MQKSPPESDFDAYTFPGSHSEVVNCLQPTDQLVQWAQAWRAEVEQFIQELRSTCRSEDDLTRLHWSLKMQRLLSCLAKGSPGSSEHDFIGVAERMGVKHFVINWVGHHRRKDAEPTDDEA